MATEIVSCIIHPGIGVARIGNSPDGYFIGPEVPGVTPRLCLVPRLYQYGTEGMSITLDGGNNTTILDMRSPHMPSHTISHAG